MFGSVGVWECGSVGVWECGSVGSREVGKSRWVQLRDKVTGFSCMEIKANASP